MWLRLEATAIRGVLLLAFLLDALALADLAIHYPGWALLLGAADRYRRWRRGGGYGDAYGSARTSGLADLWRNGLLGDKGLIVGTCGYLPRPTWGQGVRALLARRLPSPVACRLFLAAFLGKSWMER